MIESMPINDCALCVRDDEGAWALENNNRVSYDLGITKGRFTDTCCIILCEN